MKKQKTFVRNLDKTPEAIRDHATSGPRPSDRDISNWWDQFLNVDKKKEARGQLSPGQEVSLLKIEPGIEYAREIIQAEAKIAAKDQHEVKLRIQEIFAEIKKITKASKELEVEFKEVIAIERIPQNAGKYHVNFFEWVLSMVRRARMKVEDSAHWLALFKSKRSQRQYWNLFKKHGTMFGLSGERIVATQTG